MATSLSGGTLINTTFTGATKQNVTDGVETALLAAGWTTISGSGTTDCVMQSAAVSAGFQFRLRIKASTNCTAFSIEDIDGTPAGTNSTSGGGYILPAAAKTIRVIASRYNAFIFCPTTSNRDFVAVGLIAPPANITTLTQAAYMMCNAISDSDSTTGRDCWRSGFGTKTSNNHPNFQILINGTLWEQSSNANIASSAGIPELLVTVPPYFQSTNISRGYRYYNDDYITWDPQFFVGANSLAAEGKVLGNVYNMTCVADTLSIDTTLTFGGYTWYVLGTVAGASGSYPKGSLLVVVP